MTDQIAGRETARCKNGEIIGFGRVIAVVFFYPFNCRVLYGRHAANIYPSLLHSRLETLLFCNILPP